MTRSDKPWNGLGAGGIDSRRIDSEGKWNFFWAIMPKDDPTLALVLATMPVVVPKLPKLRSIEMGFASLSSGPTFFIRLKEHLHLDLFETLCRDVVSHAELAETEDDALSHSISRANRWYHLLRGGRAKGLTEDEQRGLIGELSVLERLCKVRDPRTAITSWKGPTGAPKDFELHGHCVEVKSRRAAAQPYIQISNEFQLADVKNHRLWLSVLAVDRVSSPFGETLDTYVARTGEHFSVSDPTLFTEWEMAITAAGYRQEDDYSDFRWVVSEPLWHEVLEGFPRVGKMLPPGVANLHYTIALSACEPFLVEKKLAEEALSIGNPNE